LAIKPSAVENLVDPGFWRGKRVFVTGHTGFKGSWLSLWLQSLKADLVGYSVDVPTTPSLFSLARVADGMISLEGDVRDLGSLTRAIAEHSPDVVVHMAAQSLVRRSYRSPVETYETNVMGTANLLEAIRSAPSVRVVVNVTSDKCYVNHEWEWGYRENDPKGGHDPYSSSKACAELVTSAYRDSFFSGDPSLPVPAVASVRAGNVIGGGDWAEDRLIPDIFRAKLAGLPVAIRNPEAVRPWQHVLDPLAGYFMLAQRLWKDREYADGWNFGPAGEGLRTVRWIVERLSALWGEEIPWEQEAGQHPHEARSLRLDCSRARARLGWAPRWDLEQALQSIVDWYRSYQNDENMREVSLDQIRKYERPNSQGVTA
jgi:CDP-glucose 4,6-dehydratase